MSQEEQLKKMRLEILGDVTDESKDDYFKDKLDDAEVVALNALFPYDFSQKELDKTNKTTNIIVAKSFPVIIFQRLNGRIAKSLIVPLSYSEAIKLAAINIAKTVIINVAIFIA